MTWKGICVCKIGKEGYKNCTYFIFIFVFKCIPMFWYCLKGTVTKAMSPSIEFSLLCLLMPISRIRGPLKVLCGLSVKLPVICVTQVQDCATHVLIPRASRHSPREKRWTGWRLNVNVQCWVLFYHMMANHALWIQLGIRVTSVW